MADQSDKKGKKKGGQREKNHCVLQARKKTTNWASKATSISVSWLVCRRTMVRTEKLAINRVTIAIS